MHESVAVPAPLCPPSTPRVTVTDAPFVTVVAALSFVRTEPNSVSSFVPPRESFDDRIPAGAARSLRADARPATRTRRCVLLTPAGVWIVPYFCL